MFFQDLQGSPSFWPLKLQQVLFSCLVSMLLWRIPPEPPQRYWVYHVFNPSLSIFKTLLKKSQLRMVKSSENPTRWARPPSYVYVSPCFTMFHHVSPCFTMFHHVSPCFTMFHHVSPCFTIQPLRYHTSIPILKHSSGEARVVSRAGRNKSNLPDRCNEATDFPLAKPNIPGDLNRSWQQRIQTVEHKEIELKISMAVLKLTSKLGGPKL